MKNFKSDETGAAQIIEAAIIYPVVFMILFYLIYMGLYILQCVTVESYAQKIALMAAREVAHPGYIDEIDKDAIDASVDYSGNYISLSNDPKKIGVSSAYRYFAPKNLISKEKQDYLKNQLENLIKTSSIIGNSDGDIKVTINFKNYVVVQQVEVTATQKLASFPVLKFFGMNDGLTVSSTAVASVNDSDEFIRNVDFINDIIETIGKKLGIDINNIKDKIQNVKDKMGLDK